LNETLRGSSADVGAADWKEWIAADTHSRQEPPMVEISPLRRRMIEDMTVRNLSPAIRRSYLHAVSKFSRFFGRSPDTLTLEDVRPFRFTWRRREWRGRALTGC
jgi:hypothetical protein